MRKKKIQALKIKIIFHKIPDVGINIKLINFKASFACFLNKHSQVVQEEIMNTSYEILLGPGALIYEI